MDRERNETAGTLWGRMLSIVALVLCVAAGLYFVSIAMEAVGMVLGVTGYALGARRLGALAIVLCTAAVFVSYLIGQEVGR